MPQSDAMPESVSEHTTTPESLPDLESVHSDGPDGTALREDSEKPEHIEDAGMLADSPSSVGSPDAPSEGERLAQTMEGAVLTGGMRPQYLSLPHRSKRVRLA